MSTRENIRLIARAPVQQCFSGLNVTTYWLALPFNNLVNNVSVIISNLVTKMVTQKKGHYS